MEFKRFVVLAGGYGSGKTEIALNLVFRAALEGKRAVLVDLDIVNPYFRSSDQEKMLRERGIEVIKPCYAGTTVDVPTLPPDIYSPFDGDKDLAVFDAGGEPVGAAALGLLKDRFEAYCDQSEFLYVINTLRPMQETTQDILETLYEIQQKSGLSFTGLVNNTNLAMDTTLQLIAQSCPVIREVSETSRIPIKCISGLAQFSGGVIGDFLPLELYMRPDWLDKTLK